MRLTLPFAAALLVVLAATTACSDSGASPGAKATKEPTATATPSAEASDAEDAEPFADVIEYAKDHGYAEIPAEMAGSVGELCDSMDGAKREGPLAEAARNAFAKAGSGPDSPWSRRQAAKLFDVLLDGCVAGGYTTIPEKLSHDDVVAYVAERDFVIPGDSMTNGYIAETCRIIDGSEPGGGLMKAERAMWVKLLTEMTKAQANKFVDVLFEACYETGHSERP